MLRRVELAEAPQMRALRPDIARFEQEAVRTVLPRAIPLLYVGTLLMRIDTVVDGESGGRSCDKGIFQGQDRIRGRRLVVLGTHAVQYQVVGLPRDFRIVVEPVGATENQVARR